MRISRQKLLGRPTPTLLALCLAILASMPSCGDDDGSQVRITRNGISRQSLAQASAERVVILGDSISSGMGATAPSRSYAALLYQNDGIAYPRDSDLLHHFGPHLRYVNAAHAGDDTLHVLAEQIPRLQDPDDAAYLGPWPLNGHTVVVMTAGGNDVRQELGPVGDKSDATLHASLGNMRQIFAFFADAERFPDGVTFYYGNVYDVTDGTDSAHMCMIGLVFPGLSESLEKWRVGYDALAAEDHGPLLQVVPVDLLSLFHGHGFHYFNASSPYYDEYDPTLWLTDRDCIHPNNRGHHQLRRAFLRAIQRKP